MSHICVERLSLRTGFWHAFVLSGGSAVTPALLGTIVEQNFARDMQTGFASDREATGSFSAATMPTSWHSQAAANSGTAFRIGQPGADCVDPQNLYRQGYILLQMHHPTGVVELRKVRIRPLSP